MGKILRVIALGLSLVILPLFYTGLSDAVSKSAKTFSIEIPEPTVRNESGVLYYKIRGFHSTSKPDMPKLPYKTYFFEIPSNADNITVRLKANSISMGSVKNIEISKPVIISTSHTEGLIRNLIQSSNTDAKNEKFPKSIYSIGGIRQIGKHKILAVSIYPLQYDFSTKELKLYKNISIEIDYSINSNFDYSNFKTSLLKEKIAGQIVYNYNGNNATGENLSGIKYVIITTPEISSTLEPLRDWKTKKGVPAEIYTTNGIYERYNGTPNYVFHSGTGNDLSNSMRTVIDLRNFSSVNLSFSTIFNIEYGWDFGYVEASIDGLNWRQLNGTFMTSYRDNKAYVGIQGAMAYTGNRSWIRDTISLNAYAGNVAYLRFRYITDTYVSHGGWFIDNITVNNNTPNWEFSGFEIVDINSRFNTAQNLIRNFIRDRVDNGTEFVLLAGDDNEIPAMRVQRTWYQELNDNDIVPTDYYYGDLKGNWNTDNDEIYGENDDGDEIIDWLPDVYVGRLPASNKEEMGMLVNRILKYEKNPDTTSSWFNRAVLAGGESDELTDEGYLKELVKDNFLRGYNITRLYYLNNYEHEYPLDYSNTRNQLSIGQSIVNLAGHGSYSGIAQCLTCQIFIDTDTNPANNHMLPLVYSDSCDTGAFDQDNSLGNSAIMNWAIGFIGSTRTSYYVQDWEPGAGVNQEMDYRFWEQFSNGNYKPGEILYKSKAWYVLNQLGNDEFPDAAKKNLLDYNLLGDPEIPIWTDMPQDFIVNFTGKIYAGKRNLTIIARNSTGQAVNNAIVALQKGSEIYEYKKTNSDGKAEFSINPLTEGELNITVTKHNFIPFEGNATILSDTEPPIWNSEIGIRSVKAMDKGAVISWRSAYDPSGVHYNLYYSATKEWLPVYSNINLTEINNSEFDIVVLNPDELNSSNVEMLKNSGKFVIAYIDIGKAENWRGYWNGSKDWVLENDSEWPGEYFVDYSGEEWRGIIKNYINEIRSKGFSGIYMDNIDTGYKRYDDGNSSICRNCTKVNMIEFIKNISQAYKKYNFSIFAQNGLDIALYISGYVDGFGFKDTYYYGTGNMTEQNIIVAREAIMSNLLSKGKLILTLDYTENESEIDFIYNRSGMRGFVPYVSTKECGRAFGSDTCLSPEGSATLDGITINRNHEPKSVAEEGIKIENVTPPYILKNLTNDKIYYFSVRATDSIGNEEKNNVTIVSIPSASLGCPTKGDKDCDDRVDDFEILDYIDLWSRDFISDFDLLEALENWARG